MTEPPHELPGSRSVADLRGLKPAQRAELRTLAQADSGAAEERLMFLLRRWRETLNRQYIQEVLLGGADHDTWLDANHVFTTREEQLIETIGRPLTSTERATADTVAQLNEAQQILGATLRRHHGRMVAKLYLECVVRDWQTEELRDYIEYVLEGKRAHLDWVARNLPTFRKPPAHGE